MTPQATRVAVPPATPGGQRTMGYYGTLSARYESGNRGSAAIGYDRTGGNSYGAYQIATNTGTMARFLQFTGQNYPDVHQALQSAGGDAAARAGTPAFRQAWNQLASSGRLLEAERAFIGSTHYQPLANRIQRENNIDLSTRSQALREVIWSTAVQHGGGTNVVVRALQRLGTTDGSGVTDQQLIAAIYEERATRFGSSTQAVQQSVLNRFRNEQMQAQALLATELNDPNAAAIVLARQGTQMAIDDQRQARGGGTIQLPTISAGGGQSMPQMAAIPQRRGGEVPLHIRLMQEVGQLDA